MDKNTPGKKPNSRFTLIRKILKSIQNNPLTTTLIVSTTAGITAGIVYSYVYRERIIATLVTAQFLDGIKKGTWRHKQVKIPKNILEFKEKFQQLDENQKTDFMTDFLANKINKIPNNSAKKLTLVGMTIATFLIYLIFQQNDLVAVLRSLLRLLKKGLITDDEHRTLVEQAFELFGGYNKTDE
jgi:hypothetical protein